MVEFKSKRFYYFLVIILSLTIGLNILSAIVQPSIILFLSIIFISAVLYSIITKRSWSVIMVDIWAFLLMIAGGAKIFATILRYIDYSFFDGSTSLQEIIWTDVLFRSSLLILGIAIFILSNKYIEEINPEETSIAPEKAT